MNAGRNNGTGGSNNNTKEAEKSVHMRQALDAPLGSSSSGNGLHEALFALAARALRS